MKKFLAILMIAAMTVSVMASCGTKTEGGDTTPAETTAAPTEDPADKVMTYAEYIAADLDSAVVIDAYVQAKQSWWDNKATVYTQDEDGAYFLYNMTCSEEDYAKLVPGTKIKVSGTKAAWAGEVEIVDATFEIVEGKFVASALDVTALLGTDELIKHQNEFVSFKGLTVVKVEYKNDPGTDDIYLTVNNGTADFSFCVEYYLTNSETEVYKAVSALTEGNVIDVEGFLYWYEGVNTHVTGVTVVG